jgi:hypothetical protein
VLVLDINKDQGESSNVTDEIPVLDESNTHTTYQKTKDDRISDYVAIRDQEEKNKITIFIFSLFDPANKNLI